MRGWSASDRRDGIWRYSWLWLAAALYAPRTGPMSLAIATLRAAAGGVFGATVAEWLLGSQLARRHSSSFAARES